MAGLTFGSLFAGIGGFDLGLERAGMSCKWQVEIDDYASRVLAKHWPLVHRERDIRECGKHNLEAVEVICGGFPCQDVSDAGKKAGLQGERSGLWSEFRRIVGEMGPRIVVVENVTGLFVRGFADVVNDLSQLGYCCEWDVIPAFVFGSNHRRERVFVYANSNGRRLQKQETSEVGRGWRELCPRDASTTYVISRDQKTQKPEIPRVANGIPNQMDRLRGLGNAVVPQVAEWIGRQIVEAHQCQG